MRLDFYYYIYRDIQYGIWEETGHGRDRGSSVKIKRLPVPASVGKSHSLLCEVVMASLSSSYVCKTRITKLFQIKYPIILPGMSWISVPKLVAAVSNAGGLGILATGPLSAEETRHSITEIRSFTDKPFGIGATLLMPGAKENAMVALEEKVPVINFSLGKGDWIVEKARRYGGKVIATVTTHKHAVSAVNSGVDAIMVTGHEAAAHGNNNTLSFKEECIRLIRSCDLLQGAMLLHLSWFHQYLANSPQYQLFVREE